MATRTSPIDVVFDRVGSLGPAAKGALLAAPAVLYLLVFFLLPLATVLSFSVRRQESFQMTNDLVLENYETVLGSSAFRSSLRYSFESALGATAVCLVLGVPVAYYLAVKANPRVRNLLLFLVIAPLWVNFFVRAYAILQLGSRGGLINAILTGAGIVDEPLLWLVYSRPAVIAGLAYVWFPLMVLPVYATLAEIDRSWFEAARDLGAGPLRVHREVTIPHALPGIVLGSLFVFLLSFGNYAVPTVLGGGRRVSYPQAILSQLEGAANWPVAAAAATVMMAFILILLLAVFSVLDAEELFS